MDIIASPFVTVILNMIASLLVSWGILDSHSTIAFVQVGNNLIAAIMTVGVSVVSIYKMVELQKHKMTITSDMKKEEFSQPVSQQATIGQSGLPAEQVSPSNLASGTITSIS